MPAFIHPYLVEAAAVWLGSWCVWERPRFAVPPNVPPDTAHQKKEPAAHRLLSPITYRQAAVFLRPLGAAT